MYDYVIIGAGLAGCVLANRLTEDANSNVCLLEAGPSDRLEFIHTPGVFEEVVVDDGRRGGIGVPKTDLAAAFGMQHADVTGVAVTRHQPEITPPRRRRAVADCGIERAGRRHEDSGGGCAPRPAHAGSTSVRQVPLGGNPSGAGQAKR